MIINLIELNLLLFIYFTFLLFFSSLRCELFDNLYIYNIV